MAYSTDLREGVLEYIEAGNTVIWYAFKRLHITLKT
jgi:hypothetical protein